MRREGKRKVTDTSPSGEDYIAQLALNACPQVRQHCSPPIAGVLVAEQTWPEKRWVCITPAHQIVQSIIL
jgi:hypothetical protein